MTAEDRTDVAEPVEREGQADREDRASVPERYRAFFDRLLSV